MKTLVITGSTRGIGYGLASEFLKRGHAVMLSGRTQSSVDQATETLGKQSGTDRVAGQPCDMTDYAQVQSLWDATVKRFGRVDIWINNAGVGQSLSNFSQISPTEIRTIVETNLIGMMYGSQVALHGMQKQGGGQIYNMEGFGSDGAIRPTISVYGASKYALRYITRALIVETKNTPVQVGTLSPGMVVTDLLIGPFNGDPEGLKRARRIFNILADRVETVTPFLTDGVLNNTRSGARIEWLTRPKILRRFLSASFTKRDVFNKPA